MKRSRKQPRSTERRNPRTRGLDQLSTLALMQRINAEDARVAQSVRQELPRIAQAVDAIAQSLRHGGRLIYVGAGTSGRLATLDAAECPPTFGTSSTQVVAIIAGGRRALTHSVEGAEDSAAAGARDLRALRISRKDTVVGLSASGTTPYVLGALRSARKHKATTISVTSNRISPLARLSQISIVPDTGPEVIAGSTRLKAGTAQKMVLNMLSTGAMTRVGRVYDNWMIGVAPANRKLRARARRILEEATGASVSEAAQALRRAGHNLSMALVMLKKGVDAPAAQRRIREAHGDLRRALGERPTGAAARGKHG